MPVNGKKIPANKPIILMSKITDDVMENGIFDAIKEIKIPIITIIKSMINAIRGKFIKTFIRSEFMLIPPGVCLIFSNF